jgi:sugar phosphate isomerase/epimerase
MEKPMRNLCVFLAVLMPASFLLAAGEATPAVKRVVVWDGEQASKGDGWTTPATATIKPQSVEAHSGNTALEFKFKGSKEWLGAGWNWLAFKTGNVGTDASAMKNLTFWIKTKGKGGALQLNLLCNGEVLDTPEEHTAKVQVLKYCPRLLDGEWHEVVIPLADLTPAKGFNPRIISEIHFGFMAGEGTDGSFFVDDIAFDGRADDKQSAAAFMIGGAVQPEPLFPQAPGVVSYTYREQFKQDVPGTLDTIRALGITDIEFSNLFGKTAAELRAMLDARGLACSSFGVSYDDLLNKTAEVATNARTLGAKFVRVAWLPNRQPFTLELARQTAAEFNRIGKQLREQHGLTFCYHNHGYEFVKHGEGTLFDVLMAETNPEDVSYELDILWAHFPGANPVKLLEKHGSRFKLMHLKDLKQGVKGDFSGKTAVENDVALGTGQIDLPAILKAAKKAGVQHYYIEDESPNAATQVPKTIAYLQSLAN